MKHEKFDQLKIRSTYEDSNNDNVHQLENLLSPKKKLE